MWILIELSHINKHPCFTHCIQIIKKLIPWITALNFCSMLSSILYDYSSQQVFSVSIITPMKGLIRDYFHIDFLFSQYFPKRRLQRQQELTFPVCPAAVDPGCMLESPRMSEDLGPPRLSHRPVHSESLRAAPSSVWFRHSPEGSSTQPELRTAEPMAKNMKNDNS